MKAERTTSKLRLPAKLRAFALVGSHLPRPAKKPPKPTQNAGRQNALKSPPFLLPPRNHLLSSVVPGACAASWCYPIGRVGTSLRISEGGPLAGNPPKNLQHLTGACANWRCSMCSFRGQLRTHLPLHRIPSHCPTLAFFSRPLQLAHRSFFVFCSRLHS